MTMLNRTDPDSSAALAFTDSEIEALDRLQPDRRGRVPRRQCSPVLTKLAKLRRLLGAQNDAPPAIRSSARTHALTDIVLGIRIARDLWVIERFY